MSTTDEHLDIAELLEDRKGWFVKAADDMPQYKNFRTSCEQGGRGFLGPNFGAHHIIPQESVDESTRDFTPEERKQIDEVKQITNYILNNPRNMIGLPTFWSYNAYYAAERLRSGGQGDVPSEYPGLSARWMDSYKNKKKRWLEFFKCIVGHEPINLPIHAPSTWGHREYSKQVTTRLKVDVWSVVRRQKSKHKITKQALQTIEGQLRAIEQAFYIQLTTRGATSLQLWERRKDRTDSGWYGPYTMTNIKKNPIWG